MKFHIDDLPVNGYRTFYFTGIHPHARYAQVVFPYDRIYPGKIYLKTSLAASYYLTEQYAYMCDLKRTLDATVGTYRRTDIGTN